LSRRSFLRHSSWFPISTAFAFAVPSRGLAISYNGRFCPEYRVSEEIFMTPLDYKVAHFSQKNGDAVDSYESACMIREEKTSYYDEATLPSRDYLRQKYLILKD